MNPDSTLYIDLSAAQAAGVDALSLQSSGAVLEFVNEWIEEYKGQLIRWGLEKAWRLAEPQVERFIQSLPGGDPCGSFRKPQPCPTWSCLFAEPRANKQQVVDYLVQQGFQPADGGQFDDYLGGELYARPVTVTGCSHRDYRQLALVVGCTCSWNGFVQQSYEPDATKIPKWAVLAEDPFWPFYVKWWFTRCGGDIPQSSCCP